MQIGLGDPAIDREGRVIVDSRPIYNVILSREDVKGKDFNSLIQPLSEGLSVDKDILRDYFEIVKTMPAFESILVKQDATQMVANKLLVLMDGRTLYSPLFSGTYWDVQDTVIGDVDRIEVIRGPGGTIPKRSRRTSAHSPSLASVRSSRSPPLVVRDAIAAGLGGEIDRRVHGEAAGARIAVPEDERPADVLAQDVVAALEHLRLVDDHVLADVLLPVGLDGDHLRRVHRAHDLEVLPLVDQLLEFPGDGLNAHGDLLAVRGLRRTSSTLSGGAGQAGQTPGYDGGLLLIPRRQRDPAARGGADVVRLEHRRSAPRAGRSPRAAVEANSRRMWSNTPV